MRAMGARRAEWAKQVVVLSSNIGHENCHNITDWPLSTAVNYTGEPHRYGCELCPPPARPRPLAL